MAEPAGESAQGTTRSLSIAERIRSAVLTGEHPPGTRLREVQLSESLGASRTPVRSALQALAAEGLLDYAPNRGYAVRRIESPDVMDAYDIRGMMEALAARFAAERGLSEAERAAAEQALAAGDRLLAAGRRRDEDRAAYGRINFTFHTVIRSAARCRMLGEMLQLCQRLAPSSQINPVTFVFPDVRRRHDDHHRIYEAIVMRDSYRAEILMREHVASVRASLIRGTARETAAAAQRP